MEQTSSYSELNLDVTGYMLNTCFGDENKKRIADLQQIFIDKFDPAIYAIPVDSLHITLMDWVAPLVDYGKDKDVLFHSLYDKYDHVVDNILKNVGEIHITFDTIKASTGAIFITGHDNGQFQSIRDEFMDKIDLMPGTKRPPSIIHATIARFAQEIDLTVVQDFVSNQGINFTQRIESFRLVNEKKIPMLEYDIVKKYGLMEL
jgi:hypothetical protein